MVWWFVVGVSAVFLASAILWSPVYAIIEVINWVLEKNRIGGSLPSPGRKTYLMILAYVALLYFTRMTGASDSDSEPVKDAKVLSEDSFPMFVASNRVTMVEFYAPWCGHCKRLAPQYAATAEALSRLDNPMEIGKVDCTEHKPLCGQFGVRGFPTMLTFVDGKQHDDRYSGQRTAEAIGAHLLKLRANTKEGSDSAADVDDENEDAGEGEGEGEKESDVKSEL